MEVNVCKRINKLIIMGSKISTNVQARVFMKARVAIQNDTSGPKDGAQWHNFHDCVTAAISQTEWEWRWDTAIAILCSGDSTTYGSYARDSVGGYLV